ncbi:class I SAM-dependent methyltransferase [bacterium]|nr:class I SAM-dependent methyltransferase [bacterium]
MGTETIKEHPGCPICGETVFSRPIMENTVFGQPFDVYFCVSCELYFLPSQPSGELIRDYYAKEYYSTQQRSAVSYALRSWFSKMRALSQYQYIGRHTGPAGGKEMMEIGSSDGSLIALYKQNGWKVKGLEYSEFSIKKAREKYRIELEPKDIFEIHPDRCRFDLIIFSHVLEHMPDPLRVLEHCKTLLKPGGIVFIELPQAPLGSECRKEELFQYLNTTHLFDFRTQSLAKLIEKAHLSVESMDRYFYHVPRLFKKYEGMFGRILMTSEVQSRNPFTLLMLLFCLININIRFVCGIDPMMKIRPDSSWTGFGDMIRALAKNTDA